MMKCLNVECAKDFNPKTHNQKYCSDECCRVATNKRIMQKYYEKKAIKNGAPRKCKSCPGFLSRYNTELHCSKCIKSRHIKDKNYLMGILDDIG
jgi:hypothetical protein